MPHRSFKVLSAASHNRSANHLNLETPRPPPPTRPLKLPPLTLHIRLLMTMRPKPKMLHRLSRILRSPQQQSITPRRMSHRQLIQRQALAPGLFNPRTSSSGEVESRDGEFGDSEKTSVVCDGADDDESAVRGSEFFAGAAGGEHGQAGEGHGGAVDAGHEEAAEDNFVEGGVGAACMKRS